MFQRDRFAFRHLVVALSKKKIGCLTSDNHVIWVLDGVQIIPFTRSEAHIRLEQKETALEQRKMVEDIFSTPYFYFSYSLDITNCQQKAASRPVSRRMLDSSAKPEIRRMGLGAARM